MVLGMGVVCLLSEKQKKVLIIFKVETKNAAKHHSKRTSLSRRCEDSHHKDTYLHETSNSNHILFTCNLLCRRRNLDIEAGTHYETLAGIPSGRHSRGRHRRGERTSSQSEGSKRYEYESIHSFIDRWEHVLPIYGALG